MMFGYKIKAMRKGYIHTYIHRVYLPTVPFQMAKPSDLPRGRAIEKIIFLNMIFLDFS